MPDAPVQNPPTFRQRIASAWRELRGQRVKEWSAPPQGLGGYDPDNYADNHNRLFRPLGGSRDVVRQPIDYYQSLKTAAYLFEKSALFAALHNLTAHYTVGDGVAVRANDDRTQAIIDRFLDDPHNTLFRNPREWALRFRIYGEMAMPVVVGDDGFVRFAYWNPHQYGQMRFAGGNDSAPDLIELMDSDSRTSRETPVWSTDREKVRIEYEAHRDRVVASWGAKTCATASKRYVEHEARVADVIGERWRDTREPVRSDSFVTPPNRWMDRESYTEAISAGTTVQAPNRAFNYDGSMPLSTPQNVWRVIRHRDKDESGRGEYPFWHEHKLLDGNCFYFRTNAITTSRGRPDYLQVFHLCDRYDQLLDEEIIRAQLLKAFCYAMIFENATQEQIDKLRKEYSMPQPGTVLFLNGKVKFEAISPDLAAASTDGLLKALKSHILAAGGFPPSWVGEDNANRATALAQGEPTLRGLQAKAAEFRYILETVIRFVIDSALYHGTLEKDADTSFELVMPELLSTTADGVRALGEQLTAVSSAIAAKTISPALGRVATQKLFVSAGIATEDDFKAADDALPEAAPAVPAPPPPQEEPAPLP